MIFKTIDYQVNNGIAQILLKRPDQLNAVNSLMSIELPEMWKKFNEDNAAIVAVISGFGDKSFCVGADLADLPNMDGDAGMASLESIKWTSLQNNIWKPVICAVNGMACGGGLHFVADSDIVIASDNATFFDTHVKVGLVAGLEPVSLSRKIPLERVLRMSLIGGEEKLDAVEAKNIGLISEIIHQNDLMTRATEIANKIKIHSPSALAKTKKAIWQSQDTGLNDALMNAWDLISEQQIHPDFEEGAKAFIEKRSPKWKPYNSNE